MTCKAIRQASGARMTLDLTTRRGCPWQHCAICMTHLDRGYSCRQHLTEAAGLIADLREILARFDRPPADLPHQRHMGWRSTMWYVNQAVFAEQHKPPAPNPAQLVAWWADTWRDFDGDALTAERTGTLVAPYNYLASNVERLGAQHPGFGLFVHDLGYAREWLDLHSMGDDAHGFVVPPKCPLFETTKSEPWFYLWWQRSLNCLPFFDSSTVWCHGVQVSTQSTQPLVALGKERA